MAGRLRHPPVKETESSEGALFVQSHGVRRGCCFATFEQCDARRCVRWRRTGASNQPCRRCQHPARPPIRVRFAAVAADAIGDDRPLVATDFEESGFAFPVYSKFSTFVPVDQTDRNQADLVSS